MKAVHRSRRAAWLIEAQDPATTPDRLAELSQGATGHAVKAAVAQNPNTPRPALLRLAGRYWEAFLKNPVLPLLLLEDPGLINRLPLRVLRTLVKRPDMPVYMLQSLARHDDREVREGAKYHVNMPPADGAAPEPWQQTLTESLSRLPISPANLPELLALGDVPDWLLDTLANSRHRLMRQALFTAARQPNASPRLRAVADMLRRAAGELKYHRYYHEYGHGYSLKVRRVGQGALTEAELRRLAGGGPHWQTLAAQAPGLPVELLERLARSPHLPVVRTIAQRALPQQVALLLAARGIGEVNEQLAQNPTVPEQLLNTLSRSADPAIRERLAGNRATPPATLETLAKDQSTKVRRAVATNRRTPAAALELLATDPHAKVRTNVARNGACPAAVREAILLRDPDLQVRERLIQSLALKRPVLEQLFNDPNVDIRQSAAYNRGTPHHILRFMMAHMRDAPAERPPMPEWGNKKGWRSRIGRSSWGSADIEHLIRRIYGHEKPKATEAELVEWADSPSTELRGTVAYALTTPEVLARLAADPERRVRQAVANNKRTPPEALVLLAADRNKIIRACVGRNEATGEVPHVLMQLAADPRKRVRAGVGNNKRTPPETLAELANDAKVEVREEVAGNPSTPPETLTRLAHDPDSRVWQAVMRNTSVPTALVIARLPDASTEARHKLASNKGVAPEVLWQLARKGDAGIYSALAYNPASPTDLLYYLWDQQDPAQKLNSALARHPNSPVELLERVAGGNDPHSMGYLLEHSTMTPELFRRLLPLMTAPNAKQYLGYHHSERPAWFYDALLDDGSAEVLEALAHQRHTPHEVLVRLAHMAPLKKSGFDGLTFHLVANNTVPLEVLEVLVANRAEKDLEEGVPLWYNYVAEHPNASPELLVTLLQRHTMKHHARFRSNYSRFHDAAWLGLVNNPKLESQWLEPFADHPNLEVRYALLQRPDCPPDLHTKLRQKAQERNLARTNSLIGRASVLNNPTTQPDTLRHLYPQARWLERLAMVENPNLPADLLAQLAQDAHRLVRAAAQERLTTGKIPVLINNEE